MKIATIIHYCTNDYRFLRRNVEECGVFSDQILVSYCDRFFNGEAEDRFLLERSVEENRECDFVGFAFDEERLYSPFVHRFPSDEDWLCCWHSTARYVARFFVKEEVDWLFFLDADEVVEGKRFLEWVERFEGEERAVWFYAYMYGLTARERKKEWQLTGLLVKKDALTPHQILHPQERSGMYHDVRGKRKFQAVGLDGKPMIHHYSWVRSEAEAKWKSLTWAKKGQRDWSEWLREEARVESEAVEPYFDPFGVAVPAGVAKEIPLPNFMNRRTVMELEHELL